MINKFVEWRRDGRILTQTKIFCAKTYWQRMRGLLARAAPDSGEALSISPCSGVHTFFMSYSLDVVYLNRQGRIVKIVPYLKPWRASQCFGARTVLEFRAGEVARIGLQLGDLCVDGC